MGGHSGVLCTFKRLAQQFYWPSMHHTVKEYVQSCEVYLRNKTDNLSPAGLLQPLPIPCQVWDDITMDFIEGLPSSHGRNTILVIVDHLSIYTHFFSLISSIYSKGGGGKFF